MHHMRWASALDTGSRGGVEPGAGGHLNQDQRRELRPCLLERWEKAGVRWWTKLRDRITGDGL